MKRQLLLFKKKTINKVQGLSSHTWRTNTSATTETIYTALAENSTTPDNSGGAVNTNILTEIKNRGTFRTVSNKNGH